MQALPRRILACHCGLLALLSLVGTGYGGLEGVSPRVHDVYLQRGKADAFLMNVNLGLAPASTEPLDICLVFDATMSMENVIDTVRRRARDIVDAIRGISTNSAFCVASFGDYPPYGQPWRLQQDFTLDLAAVSRALEDIGLQNGGDLPEAYTRALYESQFLTWRAEARRFLILFGDAPAHDPDFYGENLGVDPGRDGIPGTADDLRLREVVEQLAKRGIAIIAVYDTARWLRNKAMLDLAIQGFEFMAERTGGLTKPIRSAAEVPEAIKAGVREKYLPKPGLIAPPAFQGWLDVSAAIKRAHNNQRFDFQVTLRAPEGTADGIYRFPLTAVHGGLAGGGEIGRTWVIVRIGLRNYPWRWPLLLAYLFPVSFLLARAVGGGRMPIRYERNGQFWVLMWRLIVVALAICAAYFIWAYAPGTLPDPSGI